MERGPGSAGGSSENKSELESLSPHKRVVTLHKDFIESLIGLR